MSAVTLHLRWSYQHSIYDKIVVYILSGFATYSAASLLFWYLFPLKDYYSLAFPFGLTMGPILLFLMKGSLNDESVKGDWIHLLPFILSLPFYGFFISHSDFRHDHSDGYFGYMYATTFASMIGYGSYSLLLWHKAGKTKKSPSLLFLREARGFVLFLALWAALFFTPIALTTDFYLELQSAIHVLLCLCTLFIGWKLYMSTYRRVRSNVGHRTLTADSIFPKGEEEETPKTEAYTLTTRKRREYEQGMQRFIRSKGFINPEIDRQAFVAITKISPKHLHHFLQDQYGKSFSAVINKLRVEYAAQELRKSDFVKNIDDLGEACGFRSRASFYRNFTTEIGCSPLEYRANNLTLS
ncbi:helix-turn-helix transcriptional regulator [Sphingobacterium sp. SGG-5]|uniref:helix-turn-helix transcriptional regulator n=1 Tax=Sphingobacterium sp. SGG-5 TaxID=2710881 RepID=UPI0013EBAC79|nr:helix-turn-helix transcriptional regulator [Sphingobacterium sp. SGG-5]NGM62986.1 helix-turn-helix transcriptional regulator [Sphingobacterium sp. SGG-5]